jgi:penicillin-insensitive murein DD-endopeptidase
LPHGKQKVVKWLRSALCLLAKVALPAHAQDPDTLNPAPLPPLANPDSPGTPAKELFARKTTPLPVAPRSIGSYSDGCLAGAVALPINGPTRQVMRCREIAIGEIQGSSRSLRRLPKTPRRLVGTGSWSATSQPRGGPMITGHASHQIGLDVDISFTPMPDHEL